jgi:hypothetical protein
MQPATSAILRCGSSDGPTPIRDWLLCAESAMHSPALPPPHRSGLVSVSLQTRLNRAQAGKEGSSTVPTAVPPISVNAIQPQKTEKVRGMQANTAGASAGGICLQSHDRVFTRASTHDHPIPQTGSVLKSQRDRLHPATPRWTIDSRNVQNAESS